MPVICCGRLALQSAWFLASSVPDAINGTVLLNLDKGGQGMLSKILLALLVMLPLLWPNLMWMVL